MTSICGITNCPIECLVIPDVELWLQSMDSCEACLGVEIHSEDPVPIESEILCEVSGGRSLGATAFEVDAADDLEMLAIASVLDVLAPCLVSAVKVRTESVDVFHRIEPPTIWKHLYRRAFSFQRELSQVAISDADRLRDFTRGEFPETFLNAWMILLYPLSVESCGEVTGVLSNNFLVDKR
jgi:hypothetical protein